VTFEVPSEGMEQQADVWHILDAKNFIKPPLSFAAPHAHPWPSHAVHRVAQPHPAGRATIKDYMQIFPSPSSQERSSGSPQAARKKGAACGHNHHQPNCQL